MKYSTSAAVQALPCGLLRKMIASIESQRCIPHPVCTAYQLWYKLKPCDFTCKNMSKKTISFFTWNFDFEETEFES